MPHTPCRFEVNGVHSLMSYATPCHTRHVGLRRTMCIAMCSYVYMCEYTCAYPRKCVNIHMYGWQPSSPNYIHPGKRPLSSMAPVIIVDKDGNPRLVLGSAGGARITNVNAQVGLTASQIRSTSLSSSSQVGLTSLSSSSQVGLTSLSSTLSGRTDISVFILSGRTDVSVFILSDRTDVSVFILSGRTDSLSDKTHISVFILSGRADRLSGKTYISVSILSGETDISIFIL